MRVDSSQPPERWLLYSGNYQPVLTRVLKQHTPPGGYCLDIGANLGFYTINLAQWVGPAGHVAAFEANPAMVERVQDNIALNQFSNVMVVSAAVHSEPGSLEFYISHSPGKSSVHEIGNPLNKIVVPAVTIDDYVSDHDWPRLDVIKIDIEGNDCQALLGSSKTLARFLPFIVFEYKHTTPPPIAQAVFALLATLDYELWSVSSNGKRLTFNLQTSGLIDNDIMCVPPAR